MSFQSTENRTPSATATTGEPRGAKTSMPWCHPTSARAAPQLSLNDTSASTGNTYRPPASDRVRVRGGPAATVPLPPLLAVGAGAVFGRALGLRASAVAAPGVRGAVASA